MKKKYCAGKPMRSGQDPVCRPGRRAVLLVSLLLVLTMAVGGTVAFLAARTEQKTNTFTPSRVASQVIEEHFDGEVKSDAAVRNTGDTTAYIRAAVSITWMQGTDAASQTITARSPREGVDYTISYLADTGWLRGDDGFWYHQSPVAPGESTGVLIGGCHLLPGAEVPQGHHLSVEIVASAIQSSPETVVENVWHVTVTDGRITAAPGSEVTGG